MTALPVLLALTTLLLTASAQSPSIQPTSAIVPVGGSISINCTVPKNGVVLTWTLRRATGRDQPIAVNGQLRSFLVQKDNFGRTLYSLQRNATGSSVMESLLVSNMQADQQGLYTCEYESLPAGAKLDIDPVFRVTTKEGSPLVLVCDGVAEVLADASLGTLSRVYWSHQGAVADWTPTALVNLINGSHLNAGDPGKMIFSSSAFGDSGLYNCNFTVSKPSVGVSSDNATSPVTTESYSREINATIRVPAGSVNKPYFVNASSSSLLVKWSVIGEVGKEMPTFFKISYWKFAESLINSTEQQQDSFLASDLNPYTEYIFKVQACNDIGCGTESVGGPFRTKAAAPGKPVVPNDQRRPGSSYIEFAWRQPLEQRGPISGYNVSWHDHSSSSFQRSEMKSSSECMPCSVNATGLEPEKQYEFIVFAINEVGPGEAASHTAWTDIEAPAAPDLKNVTSSDNGNTLTLIFTQPTCRSRGLKCVDHYTIRYSLLNSTSWNTTDSSGFESPLIINLTTVVQHGETYTVALAGVRRALTVSNTQNVGAYSNSINVVFGSKEVMVPLSTSPAIIDANSDSSVSATVIAVSVVIPLVLCTVALVLAVVFIRRRNHHKALESEIQEDFWIELNQPLLDDQHQPYEENEYDCVPTSSWSSHIADLHADSDLKFTQEFEAVCRQSCLGDFKCLHSKEPNNRSKNRYNNILAYDHTRVLLKTIPGEVNSDYINANYVDSYDRVRRFIATQGPLPNTIDDFWRMIWEQNSAVIVMITNVYEKGRKKCEQYWPSEGEAVYGSIQVRLLKEDTEELAFWTHRRFLIQNTKTKKKQQTTRYVSHFHYTDWPDHGTPEYSLPVLAYVRQACSANPPNAGPIVVHCSAGVGRSGTFILLHSMMKHVDLKRSVNVQGFLRHIRSQRNFLVQTEDQYVFVHDALLDYIQSGGRTELRPQELAGVLELLSNLDSDGLTNVEKQYKYVVKWRPREYLLLSSKKEVNRPKNRSPLLVPVDNSSRVKLPALPGIDGSDYINASYLHGYFQNQEYIITQHPLSTTEMDFWRMVWDQNSWTLVLLSNVGEEDMLPFWRPKNEATDSNGVLSFQVTFTDENLEAMDYVTRDFLLESKQDDYEMKTRMFSITHWPETFTVDKVFEFVEVVNAWHSKSRNQAGPIVVIDKHGGKMAATFCALSTLYNQFLDSRLVDVYSLAYVYHQKRPGVWETDADYHYLYKAVAALCEKAVPVEEEKLPANGGSVHGGGGGGVSGVATAPSAYAFVRRMPSLSRSPGSGGQERASAIRHSAI